MVWQPPVDFRANRPPRSPKAFRVWQRSMLRARAQGFLVFRVRDDF
jgi:hypothetical protein